MNDNLNIPVQIQSVINEIEDVELFFVELPLEEHPKLPQFDRSIRVYDIEAKSKQQFIIFVYEQVLRDKVSGEVVNIILPAPQWVVYKETWSYLRGTDNKPIEVPYIEDNTKKDFLRVPSYKYMIWLMKKNRAEFLQLIEGYLASFVESKLEELNKL